MNLIEFLPNTFYAGTFSKLPNNQSCGVYNSNSYLRLNLLNQIKFSKLYYWVVIYDSENSYTHLDRNFHIIAKFDNKLEAQILISKLYLYSKIDSKVYENGSIHYIVGYENQSIFVERSKFEKSITSELPNSSSVISEILEITYELYKVKRISIRGNRNKIKENKKAVNLNKRGLTLKIKNSSLYRRKTETFWLNYFKNNIVYEYKIFDGEFRNTFYEFTLNLNIVNTELYNTIIYSNDYEMISNISYNFLYQNLLKYLSTRIDNINRYSDLINNGIHVHDIRDLKTKEELFEGRNMDNIQNVLNLNGKKLEFIDGTYVVIDI